MRPLQVSFDAESISGRHFGSHRYRLGRFVVDLVRGHLERFTSTASLVKMCFRRRTRAQVVQGHRMLVVVYERCVRVVQTSQVHVARRPSPAAGLVLCCAELRGGSPSRPWATTHQATS